MAGQSKRWQWSPVDEERCVVLSRKLTISPAVAQILINRGITNEIEGRRFLFGGAEELHDPFLMKDMEQAVNRIVRAIENNQKITVYGDYDVDGITATALMMRVFTDLGVQVEYYIPERQSEGYGLNGAALEQLASTGTELVVTVDCGISAAPEVKGIASRLDIIITDHHQPPADLPPAYAIINPRQPGCPYPNKHLAGVGVAFKLSQALWQRLRPDEGLFLQYLDIVAMGTIADIVPLIEENRALVKLGLTEMDRTSNAGIQALKEVCGLGSSRVDASKVGYVIAPRLNAAGRVSHGSAGVELLTTSDSAQAAILAAGLDQDNRARQAIERDILTIAEEQAAGLDLEKDKVIIVAGEAWHSGVIGIVASRLVDKYYRPVVVLSLKDGQAKGSCRSILGFNMYEALCSAAPFLTQFGGHSQAAGLSMTADNIENLRFCLNDFAAEHLTAHDYIPQIDIDASVRLAEIDKAFLEQIACLEPFGLGNRSPVFACRHLKITDLRRMGQNDQHIRLRVQDNDMALTAISWNVGSLGDSLSRDSFIDLAFIPEFNEWQGTQTIQLRSRDIQLPGGISLLVDKLFADSQVQESLPLLPIGSPEPCHPIVRQGKKGVQLRDKRNEADKLSYIRTLRTEGQPLAVVVNSPTQAYRVASAFRQRFPDLAGETCYFDTDLPEDWQRAITDWLAAGLLSVLVCSWNRPLPPGGTQFRHIVVYDIPYSDHMLFTSCGWGAESTLIHLLFGEDDIRASEEILCAQAPDRTMIGHIYLTLKDQANQNTVKSTLQQIAQMSTSRYGAPITPAAVAAALNTLSEINLLTYHDQQGALSVKLLPPPDHKLDLAHSPAYCQACMVKDDFPAFSHTLLTATVPELTAWIDTFFSIHPSVEGGVQR